MKRRQTRSGFRVPPLVIPGPSVSSGLLSGCNERPLFLGGGEVFGHTGPSIGTLENGPRYLSLLGHGLSLGRDLGLNLHFTVVFDSALLSSCFWVQAMSHFLGYKLSVHLESQFVPWEMGTVATCIFRVTVF